MKLKKFCSIQNISFFCSLLFFLTARTGRPLGMDSSRSPGPQPGYFFSFGACPVLPAGTSLWLRPHRLLPGFPDRRAADRVQGDPNFHHLNEAAPPKLSPTSPTLEPVTYLKLVPFGTKACWARSKIGLWYPDFDAGHLRKGWSMKTGTMAVTLRGWLASSAALFYLIWGF